MVLGSELCFRVPGCGVECLGLGVWDFDWRVVELKSIRDLGFRGLGFRTAGFAVWSRPSLWCSRSSIAEVLQLKA